MPEQRNESSAASRKRIKTSHPGVYYRERPDGSRQYMIWFEGTDGKAHFQNVPGGEREAKQARARIVDRLAHGHKIAPTRKLFAEFAREWLEEQVALRPKTIETYRWAIEKQLIPRLGPKTRLTDVDVNRVASLIAGMQKDGLKAWSIRGCLAPLARIMQAATRRGMAPANPVPQLDRSERPKGDQAQMNILDTDEIKLLLQSSTATYRPLFATAIFTGLRIGELLKLRWEDVDWTEGIIRVTQSKTKAGVREVVLMPALQQILAEHSLAHKTEFVFATRYGGHSDRGTAATRGLKETLMRAGVTKRIRFHDLRHTFASILISHGYELTYMAEQMGHANPSITLGVYGHLLDRKQRREDARAKLEASFKEVLS